MKNVFEEDAGDHAGCLSASAGLASGHAFFTSLALLLRIDFVPSIVEERVHFIVRCASVWARHRSVNEVLDEFLAGRPHRGGARSQLLFGLGSQDQGHAHDGFVSGAAAKLQSLIAFIVYRLSGPTKFSGSTRQISLVSASQAWPLSVSCFPAFLIILSV
jgi:hypothetical protein